MLDPISLMMIGGAVGGASGALSGIPSALFGASGAQKAEASQLGAIDTALMKQDNYQQMVSQLFSPFLSIGRGAIEVLGSHLYSSTEQELTSQKERLALEADVAKYSRYITEAEVPILTGSKASERRQALGAQMEATRLTNLKNAQDKLAAFNKEQEVLAPIRSQQQAESAVRKDRINESLSRVHTAADLPTSLAGIRAELQNDPVYNFRLEEGERAINRAQAARGSFFSGTAIRSLGDFSMALTGEETDKIVARKQAGLNMAIAGLGAEVAENQSNVGNLLNFAGLSLSGAQGVAGNVGASVNAQSALIAEAGKTQAQSQMMQSQAWSNLFQQAGQGIGFGTTLGLLAGRTGGVQAPVQTASTSGTEQSIMKEMKY